MTDTLEVFGTEFTNVTGIKAYDENSTLKTYIRPQGTKAISANGTGIDVTEYAEVDVAVPVPTPTLQSKTYTVDSAGTETVTADSGYDGLSSVAVSVPSADVISWFDYGFTTVGGSRKWLVETGYVRNDGDDGNGWLSNNDVEDHTFNAVPANTTVTPSTSVQTIGGADYMMEGAVTVAAMPTGTAGTPTATKGSVSNHAISVTPSVTNQTGYITGSTKTGTAVTVSASELVSGSETKTANGTYDVTNLAELVVNVASSSKNVQVAQSTSRATSSTYTSIVSLTCSTAGTYDVYWDCYRSTTSGTTGSQLYLGGTAYGTANTSFTNHAQTNHLTGVSISKNQTVAVYARSRGSNYYAYVGTLTIVQTA